MGKSTPGNKQPRSIGDNITTAICIGEKTKLQALDDGFTDDEITVVSDMGEACDAILASF